MTRAAPQPPRDLGPQDLVLTRRGLRFAGRLFPCAIGRGAVRTDKREGDGATPAGLHRVTGMLYRPDRLPSPNGWARPIGPRDLWADGPEAPGYNSLQRAPYAASAEALRRPDPLYDLVLLTDWNEKAEPFAGSAIFLHQWRRPRYPTEGCIAFRRDHLHWIAPRLMRGTRLWVPPL